MRKAKGLGVVSTDDAAQGDRPLQSGDHDRRPRVSAGQVALDPKSGELVGTTAAQQTEQVFKNLQAVLAAAGTSLGNVVKTTVYLADMATSRK